MPIERANRKRGRRGRKSFNFHAPGSVDRRRRRRKESTKLNTRMIEVEFKESKVFFFRIDHPSSSSCDSLETEALPSSARDNERERESLRAPPPPWPPRERDNEISCFLLSPRPPEEERKKRRKRKATRQGQGGAQWGHSFKLTWAGNDISS